MAYEKLIKAVAAVLAFSGGVFFWTGIALFLDKQQVIEAAGVAFILAGLLVIMRAAGLFYSELEQPPSRSCGNCANFWTSDVVDEGGDLLGSDPVCDAGHQEIAGLFGFSSGLECSDWKSIEEAEHD